MKRILGIILVGVLFWSVPLNAQTAEEKAKIVEFQALLKSLEPRLTPSGVTSERYIYTRLTTLLSQFLPIPVDCVPNDWVTTSTVCGTCSADGKQICTLNQERTIKIPASNNGSTAACEPLMQSVTETRTCTPPPTGGGSHPYYDMLRTKPEAFAAYSLRDQAQIEQYRRTKELPSDVVYDPVMDAAKVTVTGASLKTQVWLPINVASPMKGVLVSWDAWFGKTWDKALTGIGQYKAFNFCSPVEDVWCEINTVFHSLATDPNFIAHITGRIYFTSLYPASAYQGPNVTANNDLAPQAGQFSLKPEAWTRFWAYFDTDDQGWDTYSLWVADGTRQPVQIFNRLQLKTRAGKLGIFRLEYNTSTSGVVQSPKIAYIRNVVMLKGVTDVAPLLVKPEVK